MTTKTMMKSSILIKAPLAVALLPVAYGIMLLSVKVTLLQPVVLYKHWMNPVRWLDPNKPEQFGFARNQVTPFNFTTPDHENLYAWHVLPLGQYAKHEAEILRERPGLSEDITKTKGFSLLQKDPESRLIIYFHGNAGTVAQSWRVKSYRALADGSSTNAHILAVDYRGFGHSTGFPLEAGVITDGIATVEWALKVAKVPAEKIVIFGHSLGTAVACAVIESYVKKGVEFAGVVLVSGFTTIPDLLPYYSSGGFVRILAPLINYPSLLGYFNSHLIELWPSIHRLVNFVRLSLKVRLTIIHASDDNQIPWTESETLFSAACNATMNQHMDPHDSIQIRAKPLNHSIAEGKYRSSCGVNGRSVIRKEILPYGLHNELLDYAPVALAAHKTFQLSDEKFS